MAELKNLKWLDLKENPLTPGVASVAGLCSNARECQSCARNVVAYLSNAKRAIDDDKQRRINAVAAGDAEKIAAPIKKDGKKKKKKTDNKESKSQADKENSSSLKLDKQKTNGHASAARLKSEAANSSDRKTAKKGDKRNRIPNEFSSTNEFPILISGGFAARLCGGLIRLIFWLTVLSFLAVLGFVTLPLFDKRRADSVSNYLELKTGQPMRYYQATGTKYLEKFIDNVILSTDKVQIIVKDNYAKYFGVGSK